MNVDNLQLLTHSSFSQICSLVNISWVKTIKEVLFSLRNNAKPVSRKILFQICLQESKHRWLSPKGETTLLHPITTKYSTSSHNHLTSSISSWNNMHADTDSAHTVQLRRCAGNTRSPSVLAPRVSNQATVTERSAATSLAAPSLYLSQPVSFVKSSAG